ncbi:MAG: hypothetical protein H3C38_07600 [Rhodospirillales bacterium]|nr:hypothetical protein [Rhodospirillales bacterium]
MTDRTPFVARLAARLLIFSVGWFGLGWPVAQAELADVLDRPSLQTPRAATRTLLAVARADQRLVVVGERGIVLFSDDDGATWKQASVPVSVTLTNLHFIGREKGWAVGHSGVVLHTSDGGKNWIKQLDGITAAQIMLDAARQRGGPELAEAEALVADGPDKPFLDVWFRDASHGFVVGAYGLAFATDDGGKTWQPWSSRLPNPMGKHLYRICWRGDELWIAGEQGALFRSLDGGGSFVEVESPYEGTFFGAVAGDAGEIVAYGLRGNIFQSPDGLTWSKVANQAEASVSDGLRLADGTLILVDEAGRTLHSADGGRTFRPLPELQPWPVTGVAQAPDGHLILIGVRGVTRAAPVASTRANP